MSRLSLDNMTVEELEQAKLNAIARFDERIRQKSTEQDAYKRELEKWNNSISGQAANAWCRITNALIRKYKTMAEENPQECVNQLNKLQGILVGNNYLTEQELNEAL